MPSLGEPGLGQRVRDADRGDLHGAGVLRTVLKGETALHPDVGDGPDGLQAWAMENAGIGVEAGR